MTFYPFSGGFSNYLQNGFVGTLRVSSTTGRLPLSLVPSSWMSAGFSEIGVRLSPHVTVRLNFWSWLQTLRIEYLYYVAIELPAVDGQATCLQCKSVMNLERHGGHVGLEQVTHDTRETSTAS